jgi:Protein of unknown function (DUF4236)
MGFRFRRSFKMMPGVRVHLSKSGVSTSLGGRGASINLASSGKRTLSFGLPGTGLSYRTALPSSTKINGASSVVHAVHTIASGTNATEGVIYSTEPRETVYRIAALLGAVVLGGADEERAIIRIAGLIPEQLPNGMSSHCLRRQSWRLLWVGMERITQAPVRSNGP